jgi:hypothetical protein
LLLCDHLFHSTLYFLEFFCTTHWYLCCSPPLSQFGQPAYSLGVQHMP